MTRLQSVFADLRTIDVAMYAKMNERFKLAAEYGQLRRLRAETESQLQDAGRQLGSNVIAFPAVTCAAAARQLKQSDSNNNQHKPPAH